MSKDWRARLFKARFLLLRNREDLTANQAARLKTLLADEKRLRIAWELKEDLRAIPEGLHSLVQAAKRCARISNHHELDRDGLLHRRKTDLQLARAT